MSKRSKHDNGMEEKQQEEDEEDEEYDDGEAYSEEEELEARADADLLLDDDADELFDYVPSKRKPGKKKAANVDEDDDDDIFIEGDYHQSLQLIDDPKHTRPLWITPTGHIFIETFNQIYARVYDFIITIAEPSYRPKYIHEYQLTPYSLYGAVSVGLTTSAIIDDLSKLCKSELPVEVVDMINECTKSYGKAKLVLHNNKYYIDCNTTDILQTLIQDDVIGAARIEEAPPPITDAPVPLDMMQRAPVNGDADEEDDQLLIPSSVDALTAPTDEDPDDNDIRSSLKSFSVSSDLVTSVKKRCSELGYPLLEEYDFRNDPRNPSLEIDLKPSTTLRPYQEKSLSMMFRNGRARSGMIVLACGAGKTLVGVTAACTMKKSVLVLCTSGVAVEQWRDQFLLWSNVETKMITRFTSKQKEPITTSACIVVSTYSMITHSNLNAASRKVLANVTNREFGLLIMDEVHVVPAKMFRKVLDKTNTHCKLGLTATLVREDDLVADLNFLIGPKLYEASWLDLSRNGYIATVQPAEVWCPMTPEFMGEYMRAPTRRKDIIASLNPNKFLACQFLIQYHEARGDKILVFSDNVFALREYATAMKRPYIFGAHSTSVRNQWFQRFRYSDNVKTLFLSKIGDNSIDLPAATVLIQITFQYGSRRQEAQRLGRLLRPKGRRQQMLSAETNAYFYSLVSQDTREVYFSTKRQQFLIAQGYSFKIIKSLPLHEIEDPVLDTREKQKQLLVRLLTAKEVDITKEKGEKDNLEEQLFSKTKTKRKTGSLRSFTAPIANDRATLNKLRKSIQRRK